MEKLRSKPWLGALAFALLACLCAGLVSLDYPFGIATPETTGYATQAEEWQFWEENRLDWWRTPPFPLWLRLAAQLPRPDLLIVAANFGLFSLNCGLLFLTALGVWNRVELAAAVTGAFLAIQVALMQSFFLNFCLTSDPLFAQLLLLACLLGTWSHPQGWIGWMACPVLGLAIWLRPAGLLIPLAWLPLWARPRRIAGGLMFCYFPIVLWAARNFMLFGAFLPAATVNYQALRHLVAEGDANHRYFDDDARDRAFRGSVRALCHRCGLQLNPQLPSPWRVAETDRFFPWEGQGDYPEPFLLLLSWNSPENPTHSDLPYNNAARMFQFDQGVAPFARQAIRHQCWVFLHMVGRDYYQSFLWHDLPPNSEETPHVFPEVSYRAGAPILRNYPWLTGKYQVVVGSGAISRVLLSWQAPLDWMLGLESLGFLLIHAVAALCLTRWRKHHLSRLFLIWWGTAAAHHLALALAEPPRFRYSMAVQMLLLVTYLGVAAQGWEWRRRALP